MALLTRYFQLEDGDGGGSQVFNFVVTKSVTREFGKNVVSKEFEFGFHKWALSFVKADKTLGANLVWRSASEGITVSVDMTVTLFNKEQFAENRTFSLKRATFQSDHLQNGCSNFVQIGELLTHRPRFVDLNGEFQVELQLSKAETHFDGDLPFGADALRTRNGGVDDVEHAQVTNEFLFGEFSWALKVRPQVLLTWSQAEPGLNMSLTRRPRNQSQGLLCRLCYSMSVGAGERRKEGERRDEIIAAAQSSQEWSPKARVKDCLMNDNKLGEGGGLVRVRVDLLSAHVLSEFVVDMSPATNAAANAATAAAASATSTDGGGNEDLELDSTTQSILSSLEQSPFEKRLIRTLTPKSRAENTSKAGISGSHAVSAANTVTAVGADVDGTKWALEVDLHSSFLRVSLVCTDINKIPRNHLRFVQWRSFLVRRSKRWRGHRDERRELVEFQSPGNLFARYYTHDDSDQGVMMETTVPTKEIREGVNEFLEEGNLLRVRIQWELVRQMFQATIHQYDEVVRHHNVQMRDEIAVLREHIRILEQNQQKEKSLSLAPPRRKKLDSTDSAESTASSNSNNGGERSLLDGGERSLLDGGGGRNGGHVGHRGRSGRSVKPVPPVLTLPLPNSGQSPTLSPTSVSRSPSPRPPMSAGLTRPRHPFAGATASASFHGRTAQSPFATAMQHRGMAVRNRNARNTFKHQCSTTTWNGSNETPSLSRQTSEAANMRLFPEEHKSTTASVTPTPPAPATSNATTMTSVDPHPIIEDADGDTCTPPNSATGSVGSGSGSLWDSPAIQRVIAPLKHTISMSVEHLPPRAKSPLARMQWAVRQSHKCQSVD